MRFSSDQPRTTKRLGGMLAAILGLALTMGMASPANADSHVLTFEEIQQAVLQVKTTSPDLFQNPTAPTEASANVTLPDTPTDGVRIAGPDGDGVTVHLPNVTAIGPRVELNDGSTLYPGTASSANVVIPTRTGAQLITVIGAPEAPTRYDYPLELQPGQHLVIDPSGAALLLNADKSLAAVVAAPWARDARGQIIPTHYETDGAVLTQVIDHTSVSNVAYPVVADPDFGCGIGYCSIYFNKAETLRIAEAGDGAAEIAISICLSASLAAGIVCALVGGPIIVLAKLAVVDGKCLGYFFGGLPPLVASNPFEYEGEQCK